MIDNRPILLARNGETDLHRGRRTYNETDGLIVRRTYSEAGVAYVVVVNNNTVMQTVICIEFIPRLGFDYLG